MGHTAVPLSLPPGSSLCPPPLVLRGHVVSPGVARTDRRALSSAQRTPRLRALRRKESEESCVGEAPNPVQSPWAGIKGRGVSGVWGQQES